MKQRGRQSAQAKAIKTAGVVAIPRAAPPPELSDYEAAKWSEIVATKPSDWFTKDTECLLLSYVKHWQQAATIDKQLTALMEEAEKAGFPGCIDPDFLKTQDLMYRMRERETKMLAMLATKMRLAQQSRIHPESSGRKAENHLTGRKPWERIT